MEATLKVKASLDKHKQNVPYGSLPPIIQDSITAARGLGFAYLWVDSLCVIQDDAGDWEAEASKMGTIYPNASLTMSTLTSKDSSERLFSPWAHRQLSPVLFLVAVRGWALQEQLLSQRVLWFGPGCVYWGCRTLFATEKAPNKEFMGRDKPVEIEFAHSKRVTLPQPLGSDVIHTREDLYKEWEDLVAQYTQRTLLFESDRIPAIFSLAKAIEPRIGHEFIIVNKTAQPSSASGFAVIVIVFFTQQH
ncbi:hypothetical protein GGTG_06940 [Gaeumannomyces tritici R3-111a-1]|uniref:Heterokaryon incompatibility domain-containing protein n=1 Tax=Gaeumannomyces tritici (strain R3-111a-1) TaxID=644352 RepID=J3P093_GAET3|nr:hypothetical protein GGTG_06940 [Gaeumannomyces tritici R3-111a-1]EJT77026.1 hypothetical protein GGTG_06940 [Gaeumannomyces tritici R3-111a-1]